MHRAKRIDIYLSHVLHEVLLHVLACWKEAEFLKTYWRGNKDIFSLVEMYGTGLYGSASQTDVCKGDFFFQLLGAFSQLFSTGSVYECIFWVLT